MEKPNILLIHTDQQRWDAVGVNGNPDIKTPNLDRLAEEGVNFDHYFVQNPVCMPSRVSYLTGQYPSKLGGIYRNGVPVPEDTITLPKMLENYGYISANIGKLHFLPHANRDHRDVHPDYGFDHLEISDEPGCYEDAYRAWVRCKDPQQLEYISVGLPPAAENWYKIMGVKDNIVHPEERFPKKPIAFRGKSEFTHSAFVAEQTIEFIKKHSDQNFLCIAGFYSPHSPWVAPQEFLDLYKPDKLTLPEFPPEIDAKRSKSSYSDQELRGARHGYYAMVSEVDHHVGRILSCLAELGLEDDTILIFTSDHGEYLGEHLRYGKGAPGHDCISRVPFIIRWPNGIVSPGRTESGIVEAVDMLPTLLECAGIPVPYHLQGRSVVHALKGKEYEGRESALLESTGMKTLRTERYRYVSRANGKETLYDLEKDPHEYQDVTGNPEYADLLSEMRHKMLKRLIEIERPARRVWSY